MDSCQRFLDYFNCLGHTLIVFIELSESAKLRIEMKYTYPNRIIKLILAYWFLLFWNNRKITKHLGYISLVDFSKNLNLAISCLCLFSKSVSGWIWPYLKCKSIFIIVLFIFVNDVLCRLSRIRIWRIIHTYY